MKRNEIRSNKFTQRIDHEPQLITQGIDVLMWHSIENAINKRDNDLEKTLFDFMLQAMYLSIRHRSIAHFQHYIFFPARLYEMTEKKYATEKTYYDSHKEITERSTQVIRNMLALYIGVVFRAEKNFEKRKELSNFYYWSFSSYSLFLYTLFRKNDSGSFKNALQQFYQLSDPTGTELYSLQGQKRQAMQDLVNPDVLKIRELSTPIEILERFGLFKRRVVKSIFSWIIYMYHLNEIQLKNAKEYLESFKPFENSRELVDDLFFYAGTGFHLNYMGWSSWDHTQRNDMETYAPPQPSEWLTFGAVVEIISTNNYPNFSKIREKDISQALGVMVTVKSIVDEMQKNEQKWLEYFNLTAEEFNARTGKILDSIKQLDRRRQMINERYISTSELSKNRIAELTQSIGTSWERQSRIHWLFDTFGNTAHINDEKIKLKIIGLRNYLPKGKMMLIENEYYQPVYGIDDLGGRVGRWEDDDFFATVLEQVTNKVAGNTIVETLEKAFTFLTENEIIPDLVLLPLEYSYQDNELSQHADFTPLSQPKR